MTRGPALAMLGALLVACYPTTTRPDLTPSPEAPRFEVELDVVEATRMLALELDTDSIPVSRTEPLDGWLETEWFDATTLQPAPGWRVGPGVVKLRAFVDPGRANHSMITVEVVERLLVNPSLPARELERQVSAGAPILLRVQRAVGRMSTP
jgi:hypothetical protein